FFRTIVTWGSGCAAVVDKDITLELLVLPDDFPGVHVHGDNGIRAFSGRFAHAVACADINPMPLGIDCWRIPHRTACRTIKCYAVFVLAAGFGLLRNDECPPQFLASIGVESHDVTTERAAFIAENRARSRLHCGHWNVNPAVVNRR